MNVLLSPSLHLLYSPHLSHSIIYLCCTIPACMRCYYCFSPTALSFTLHASLDSFFLHLVLTTYYVIRYHPITPSTDIYNGAEKFQTHFPKWFTACCKTQDNRLYHSFTHHAYSVPSAAFPLLRKQDRQ